MDVLNVHSWPNMIIYSGKTVVGGLQQYLTIKWNLNLYTNGALHQSNQYFIFFSVCQKHQEVNVSDDY